VTPQRITIAETPLELGGSAPGPHQHSPRGARHREPPADHEGGNTTGCGRTGPPGLQAGPSPIETRQHATSKTRQRVFVAG